MAFFECLGLTKSFDALKALSDFGLTLERGEVVGVIGPNGAGKTTLFNLITGLLRADSGEIYFKGKPIAGKPPHEICRLGIARTFQVAQPFGGMSVLENALVGALYGGGLGLRAAQEKAMESLERVGLGSFANIRSANLTVADSRRLELARALATGAELVLMDETMAGLTVREMEEALKVVEEVSLAGRGIILVEHIMRAVTGVCGRVVVLDFGNKLTEGSPREVMEDPRVIAAYLGEKYA